MNPLDRPEWRGRTNVDALTIAAIEAAEKLAGRRFGVTQGSYNTTVDASAGTHAGGGVVDLTWKHPHRADVLALRRAGFAAWHRTPGQGPWVHHVHAVLIDHPALSPAAARQVTAYRNGRNGLANSARDDGPRLDPIPVFNWKEHTMSWKEPLPRWDGPGADDTPHDSMWSGQQLNQARGYAIAAAHSALRAEKAVEALAAALGPKVENAVRDALADAVVDVDVTVNDGTEE